MDNNSKELCSISDALFAKKRMWDTYCQEVAEQYYPMRADFTRTLQLGEDFATGTMDGAPIQNRETLGNAIDSMLRQGEWYEISTGDAGRDKKQDNALALAFAGRRHRALVRDRRANWDRATKVADMDWVTFGAPVLSVEFNHYDRHLVFRDWHPRDIAMLLNSYGAVNAVHRKASMSARDICERADRGTWKGTVSPEVRIARALDPTRPVRVRHVLMPMDEVYGSDPAKRRKMGNAKYLSIYIDLDHQEILNEAPSRVWNYVTPRWRTLNGSAQGFSPIIANSLPDARMLQAMAMVIIEQGQKAVDPPMVGAAELFASRDINLYAGGFTHVDLPDGADLRQMMTTVDTSQGLNVGLELKQDLRELLAEAFLLNKLFLPNVHQMTAEEASLRTEEFRRAALPFFTPIQSEYHEPLLAAAWDMGVNVGLIDMSMFPPDLHGQEIAFQFSSPLEAAEGQQVVAAFQQSMAVVAAGAQVDQTVTQMFDWHAAAIDAVRGTGAPLEWILPPDKLAAAQQKAAEDKQLADLAQKATVGSQVAQQLSGGVMAARQAGLAQGPPGAMPAAPAQAA